LKRVLITQTFLKANEAHKVQALDFKKRVYFSENDYGDHHHWNPGCAVVSHSDRFSLQQLKISVSKQHPQIAAAYFQYRSDNNGRNPLIISKTTSSDADRYL
tara:strand:+ start:1482 stop:1787 length:306 start_codon:yes stop_codon:yes gene_type:complete